MIRKTAENEESTDEEAAIKRAEVFAKTIIEAKRVAEYSFDEEM